MSLFWVKTYPRLVSVVPPHRGGLVLYWCFWAKSGRTAPFERLLYLCAPVLEMQRYSIVGSTYVRTKYPPPLRVGGRLEIVDTVSNRVFVHGTQFIPLLKVKMNDSRAATVSQWPMLLHSSSRVIRGGYCGVCVFIHDLLFHAQIWDIMSSSCVRSVSEVMN